MCYSCYVLVDRHYDIILTEESKWLGFSKSVNIEESSKNALSTYFLYCEDCKLFIINEGSTNIINEVTSKGSQIAMVIKQLKFQMFSDNYNRIFTQILEIDFVSIKICTCN